MNVILLTDTETIVDYIVKNTKINIEDLNVGNFTDIHVLKNEDVLESCAAVIFYAQNPAAVTPDISARIAYKFGVVQTKRIPIYSNINLFDDDFYLFKDKITFIDTKEELAQLLDFKYDLLCKNSFQKGSKISLIRKGISFSMESFINQLSKKSNTAIVKSFLDAGINVNGIDEYGTPVLNLAVRNNKKDYVALLVEYGADINNKSKDRGYTALMDAVWRGNREITELLISKGADVNTKSRDGETDLIIAVGAGKEDLCELLIKNGADPDLTDDMEMSAWDYAKLFKNENLISLLKASHKE